jgi:hypothetical protein
MRLKRVCRSVCRSLVRSVRFEQSNRIVSDLLCEPVHQQSLNDDTEAAVRGHLHCVEDCLFANQKSDTRFTILRLAALALVLALDACASDASPMTIAAGGASGEQASAGSSASAGASPGVGGAIGSAGMIETGGGSPAFAGTAGLAGVTQEGGAAGMAGAVAQGGAAEPGGSGGTAPSNAGAGGTEPQPYNPCPPKGKPCVILPVGDSITAGSQSSTGGGYRLPLFQLATTNMKSLTFVGANASGPATVDGVSFPRANSGYSGYEIDSVNGRQGISQFFPAQIAKYKPNIILLMIGTNDVASAVPNIPHHAGRRSGSSHRCGPDRSPTASDT